VRRSGRNRPRARHLLAESLPADHLDIDYHDHHFLVSAGDGCLLRRGGLRRGRHAGMSSVRRTHSALSIGHDLHGDGSDLVRVHGRVDPVRRSQTERYHLQFLQVGNLPAGDDVRWDTEERRVRFRLRLPLRGLAPNGLSRHHGDTTTAAIHARARCMMTPLVEASSATWSATTRASTGARDRPPRRRGDRHRDRGVELTPEPRARERVAARIARRDVSAEHAGIEHSLKLTGDATSSGKWRDGEPARAVGGGHVVGAGRGALSDKHVWNISRQDELRTWRDGGLLHDDPLGGRCAGWRFQRGRGDDGGRGPDGAMRPGERMWALSTRHSNDCRPLVAGASS